MPTAFRIAARAHSRCSSASGANAQSLPKEVATRTEIYPIPSLTLSDQQFLSGDAAAGKPVRSRANSASRKAPARSRSWC